MTLRACQPVRVEDQDNQPPDRHLSAGQLRSSFRASRCARISGWSHRAADASARESSCNRAAIAGPAHQRGRGARTGTYRHPRLMHACSLRTPEAQVSNEPKTTRAAAFSGGRFVAPWSRRCGALAARPMHGRQEIAYSYFNVSLAIVSSPPRQTLMRQKKPFCGVAGRTARDNRFFGGVAAVRISGKPVSLREH